jgi:hypothetical protein
VVLIFNLAGGAVLALSVATWIAFQLAGFDLYQLVAGFAVMSFLSIGLELQRKPSWRPRYFWVVPGWLAGLTGEGLALHDAGSPVPGYLTLGAAGAAFVALIVHASTRRPGGRWLVGLASAGAIVVGFQVIGYARPEWKHPVLYGVNAVALVASVFCAVQLYRARKAAAATPPGHADLPIDR